MDVVADAGRREVDLEEEVSEHDASNCGKLLEKAGEEVALVFRAQTGFRRHESQMGGMSRDSLLPQLILMLRSMAASSSFILIGLLMKSSTPAL